MADKLRVLVCDDSENTLFMLKRMVEERGDECVGMAHNGKEAIEMVASLKPDLLIIDIAMPHMDGETAVAEINKAEYQPRVVFATNQGRTSTKERVAALGAGMVVKPYQPILLYREIERVMAQ